MRTDRGFVSGNLYSVLIMFALATKICSETVFPIMWGLITNSEKVQRAHLTEDCTGSTWGMRMTLLCIFGFCTLIIYGSIPVGLAIANKATRLWDKI